MEKYIENIDETIVEGRLQNGLNYYIIPKGMYTEKRALITVKYGSIDGVFESEGSVYESPLGTAHFLEHKLFDNDRGSAFDSFSKLGAYVNAYTSFNNTAYYFSCDSNFEKSLKTLLSFVSEPYFTDETVGKEVGIIEREISMYDDNPGWEVYFNMLSCLYENHPAKNSIAGTAESIREITKDTLYKCYESFYVPENMYLICAGGFDEAEISRIIEIAESYPCSGKKRARTIFPYEPEKVSEKSFIQKAKISRPVFQLGFKQKDFREATQKLGLYKIMLDLFVGESSELKQELVESGFSDDTVSFDYVCGNNYGYAMISGESQEPEKLFRQCVRKAEALMKEGFASSDFDRIKKKHSGRFARGFNSVEAITSAAAEYAVKGASLTDCYESFINAEIDKCNCLLEECFREGGYAISVLTPEGGRNES